MLTPSVHGDAPKALAAAQYIARRLDALSEETERGWEGTFDEYLTYQYIPHPNTIFRGFHKLPPGHYAVYQDDKLDVRPYWPPDFTLESRLTKREAVDQLRELLTSAVKLRMRSDVPLGAFLSGGVDSSIIVALMQQHSAEPIKTFTIGFPRRSNSATAAAQRTGFFQTPASST